MDEAVLILFQPLLLVGVVEIGSLQLLQLLFQFSPLLIGALLLLLKCRQRRFATNRHCQSRHQPPEL